MAKWYDMKLVSVKNSSEKVGEIYIYGEIVDDKWFATDVTPTDFIADLKALGDVKTIHLYMNSYGGNVWAGVAIYNQLKRHPANVIAHVDGIAASISAAVIQAADKIYIPRSGMIMVHKPWAIAIGDADEMNKIADVLDKLQESIESIFIDRGKVDAKDLKEFIDAETWFTGDEAVANGFADEIEKGKEIKASMQQDKIFINDQEIKTDHFKAFPNDKFKFKDDTGTTGDDDADDSGASDSSGGAGTADNKNTPKPADAAASATNEEEFDEMLDFQAKIDEAELTLQEVS